MASVPRTRTRPSSPQRGAHDPGAGSAASDADAVPVPRPAPRHRSRYRRPFAVLAAVVVLATACGDDGGGTADPATSAPDRPATDTTGAPVDDGIVTVPQIASTPREDVPSALDDETAAGLPTPLIDFSRVLSGGPPPDGIPAIDEPKFQRVGGVDWLQPEEAVLALEIDGEARAYPIQIMTWHELVNDTIGDTPVTIGYCPLCNSALAYDRRVGDRILDFGTSGRLFNSSLVMYDRQTQSLWTHFDGTAVAGVLTGTELDTYPISTVSWEDFSTANPDALVLSRETGYSRAYGRNPYVGYDDASTRPFLYDGDYDPRLEPKTRVVVVRDDVEPAVVVPLTVLQESGVVAFEAFGRQLVAVNDPGTASPLSAAAVDAGYEQGATGVFEATLDGRPVSLQRVDGGFLDEESGQTFDVFGHALGGDARLTPVEHLDTFWFAIAAFEPDATIVGA